MPGGWTGAGNPQEERDKTSENTSGTGEKTSTMFTFSLGDFHENNIMRLAFSEKGRQCFIARDREKHTETNARKIRRNAKNGNSFFWRKERKAILQKSQPDNKGKENGST